MCFLKKCLWIRLLIIVLIVLPMNLVAAQEQQPDGPVYIVQEGDTLWSIAQRFRVSVEELKEANQISDPSRLLVGTQLVIPGMEGVQGVLTTKTVGFGDTLRGLSRRYQVSEEALMRLNHLVSPMELYAGASLIIPESHATTSPMRRLLMSPGQSLLELAVLQASNPWSLVIVNHLSGTWEALPGDVLLLPDERASDGPSALPSDFTDITVTPLPLVQGKTTVIRLTSQKEATLSGSLIGHELHFFRDEDGSYVALQGVHAMTSPGFYPLTIRGTLKDGSSFAHSQMVYVKDGGYPYEPSLKVAPETIDPANTQPEDELWNSIPVPVTEERMWDGVFQSPVSPLFADCYPSYFGSRRSYNGSPYNYFHTGLDFCGGVGAEIFAPADGIVVYTGTLTVRGMATMINHGWGVYSGYMHQSEILVKVGDRVEAGQLIGRVGGTGRVTGSHLHLEIWVGGVQVDPMDWLNQAYP
jgi:murein DD-endopeptidase MepM/ murein hydrolase activator NlpD